LLKKFFSEINYRRVIIYTVVLNLLFNWLFEISLFHPFIHFKLISALALVILLYYLNSENRDDFLIVTILYILIEPLLDYLIGVSHIDSNVLPIFSIFLVCISWRLDSTNKNDEEINNRQSESDYFNLIYINSAKSYEIATDDTVKKSIQKENSNVFNQRNSLKLAIKNSLESGVESRNEFTKGSIISENFEIKSTKSTIFRKVYKMSKNFEEKNLQQGDLVKFENISLKAINAQDIPLILQVLQSSKLENHSSDGIELDMSNLLSTFLSDYTIDYSFIINKDRFLVRFPYREFDGFENGYSHSDFQLGKLCLVGIDRGKVDFSEVDTISTKFLEFMSTQANSYNKNEIHTDSFPKSSDERSVDNNESQFQFDFNYKKLTGEYRLIDAIAVVQKINVENKT